MRTRITELLGIEHPIFQGAMAWIADASLASAVSNAGGLGILAGGSASADVMARQIDETKARTDKPFALNIMLMSPHADDLAQLAIDKGVRAVTTGAGAHEHPEQAARAVKDYVVSSLRELEGIPVSELVRRRQERFSRIGVE